MRSSEIGMVLVLVPPSVKSRVRVGVVDTEPIVWLLSIPLDGQFRRLRPCQRIETSWIKTCPQLLGLDIIRNELDRRDLWHTVKNVSLQLGVEVCVRVTTGMRDRHPSATGLGRLVRWSEKVPFADGEPDDIDAPLEVFPLAGGLTATVFFIGVETFLGEGPAKLVR
jgi:hypothetical protein